MHVMEVRLRSFQSVGLAGGPDGLSMGLVADSPPARPCPSALLQKSTQPQVDLMDMQPELQWYMRPFLTEFLIEIHQQFRLRPEVLYLAMNIVDRYVSKRVVFKKHYQLVGCAALWIAAKFEVRRRQRGNGERQKMVADRQNRSPSQDSKDKVPTVEMLRDMCCNAYDESAFIQMEGHVLSTINWCLGHPTAESWLRLACMGTSVEDAETQHVARFVMELSLFHKEFVGFLPSSIAAGALMLARFLLRKSRREVDEQDPSVEVAFLLDTHLGERLEHVSEIVVGKYSHSYYNRSSAFVREQYLKGRRFEIRVPVAAPLLSPALSAISSSSSVPSLVDDTWSRSSSSSSIVSDFSPRRSSSAYSFESDMPETPTYFADAAEPFVVLPDSQPPPPVAMSLAVPAGGKETRSREKTVVPARHAAGYVVQEPRTVFQSLQQQANGVYQPAPPVAVRRFSG
jgi:hypothetical protein